MLINIYKRRVCNKNCPYCRDSLKENIEECPGCQTQYHRACLLLMIRSPYPKCAILGCKWIPIFYKKRPPVLWTTIHPWIRGLLKPLDYFLSLFDPSQSIYWKRNKV